MANEIDLGLTCDMHVHLREGAMCELVTPTIRQGGISVAYVMPNLVPPITSIDRVVEYKNELERLAPSTTFLMSFYLSKDLTPELIHKAAKVIHGVKCYPAGVTTNSTKSGVDPNNFSAFYPIFEAMQEEGLVLNLHGEKPSTNEGDIHVINAEESFLPALERLHRDFPDLKIVLEHCTTEAAVKLIHALNDGVQDPKVAATLTAHHLHLTIDDWAGNPINFCKPVAKFPKDKKALIDAATSGKPYFFFGSDSAPHPISSKNKHIGVCAGVYTQSLAIPYLAEIFEQNNALDRLPQFVSHSAKKFYGIESSDIRCHDRAVLYKKDQIVPEYITNNAKTINLAPFKPGQKLKWSVKWQQP